MPKTINGQLIEEGVFEGGSVLLPSIRFANSLLDGFYRIGANNIALALNAIKAVDFSAIRTLFVLPVVFSSAVSHNVTNVNAATYALLTTDYILDVTYTSTGAVTSLSLPTAQMVVGRTIVIKDTGLSAGTNNITITTEGAELIDGSNTFVMNTNGESVTIFAKSTGWFII